MSFSIACLDAGEDSQQEEVFIRNAIGIESGGWVSGLAIRHLTYSVKEIAEYLRVHYATVSRALRRMERQGQECRNR